MKHKRTLHHEHLLLTVLTLGIWSIVWMWRARVNYKANKAIDAVSAIEATECIQIQIDYDGHGYPEHVVGTSFYQDEIECSVGSRLYPGETQDVMAKLILEDRNKHDDQAVSVNINGSIVGYLDRLSCRMYRKKLTEKGYPKSTAMCRARVLGADVDHSMGVRLAIKLW